MIPEVQITANIHTISDVFRSLREFQCPDDILPFFWEPNIMHNCNLYAVLIDSFTDHELVQDPAAALWCPGCMACFMDEGR